MFNKLYQLSLTRNYVSKWGVVQAVRELIQNALDSESPFVYSFAQEDEDAWRLELNSQFTTLLPSTLLLGSTSKTGSDKAIGSFGEGFKIALLVLTRAGYDTELLNGDLIWRPRFKFNKQFGEELLVVEEESALNKTNKGLTAVVHGLTDEDKNAVIMSCLQMQEHVGKIATTQFGDILYEQAKRLYVGGLFICETELMFGYNIKPEHIALERDRQTVSGWDLRHMTLKIWLEAAPADELARMLEKDVPDLEYAQYGMPEIVKEECYKLFRANHPRAVIASSQEELKQMVASGLTKTIYVGGGYGYGVTTSRGYRSEVPPKHLITPTAVLEKFFKDNGKLIGADAAPAVEALLLESKAWVYK